MSLININPENFYKRGEIGLVRKAQEDSHDFAPMTCNGDVFVVCDGMGGHVGGAKASSLAVESILSFLKEQRYDSPIEALDGALKYANMQILGFADEHPEYRGMGTTACIVLFRDNDVWIAHVGDSRIYLFLGKERQLHRITKDHSYVQSLVEAGEITDDQAEHHPMKNRITKALGIRPELQPTFNEQSIPIHPKDGDIFMICTDGLSGMVSDKTMEQVLGEDIPLEQKGNRLVDLAMQGEIVQPGGQDNCTLELIRVEGSPWQESQFRSYNPAGRPLPMQGARTTGTLRRSFWRSPWVFIVPAALVLLAVVLFVLKPAPQGPKPAKASGGAVRQERPALKKDVKALEDAVVAAQTEYENACKAVEKDSLNLKEFDELRIKAKETNNKEAKDEACRNIDKTKEKLKDLRAKRTEKYNQWKEAERKLEASKKNTGKGNRKTQARKRMRQLSLGSVIRTAYVDNGRHRVETPAPNPDDSSSTKADTSSKKVDKKVDSKDVK